MTYSAAERVIAFDNLMSDTTQILEDPDVKDALGSEAARYTQTNSNVFMPNIRSGVISLPRQYADTEYVAVIPLGHDELRGIGKLALGRRMYSIPRGMQRLKGPIEMPELEEDQAALTLAPKHRHQKGARALVFVTPKTIDRENAILPSLFRASTMVHEYTHCHDFYDETYKYLDPSYAQAATELRGYHMHLRVLEAVWSKIAEHFVTPRLLTQVEEIRVKHTRPAAPFIPNQAGVNALRKLRVIS